MGRDLKSMDELNLLVMEKKWQDWWEETGIYEFDPDSDREPYTIDNPPRYASGALHIGHAVHYTHIDFAARYQRMMGKNVMFPLCFDVNGMPIEVNVEKKYDIRMKEYDRHAFIELCEEFAEENIGAMIRQFKILGESMDPSVYYQTDAEYYRRLTQISFIRLFKKGLIYKDRFPVNWCPRCGTALAESEVEYTDRTTILNYCYFKDKETGKNIPIATTRPELLCTCQMVALHPDDPRAQELRGKALLTPIYEREVPVMMDPEVDSDFGTGVVMVCTIGDRDDLNWVFNYGLDMEMGIDEEGKMTGLAGEYEALHLEEARKAIIEDMKEEGLIYDQEPLDQSIGVCWRCSTPIEFVLTPQWFLKTLDFKLDVLKASDSIEWYPEFMRTRLEEWVESLSWDWVISRQRYFGTPIPAWECTGCDNIEVPDEEECYIDLTYEENRERECPECGGTMIGSEEVFDTWMDSSITPLYNTFWQRDDERFDRLFPMSLRPQSHDIIRTWAFYTILRSKLLTDDIPFENIMMGGFILSPDGTPMHASKNNVIDPLEILEEYGADPMRYYATTCALGKDNPFRIQDVVRGRSVCRKLYSIARLISVALDNGREGGVDPSGLGLTDVESSQRPIDKWLLSYYSELVEDATEDMERFRFDQAVRKVLYFMWHRFADHYLEIVKRRIYGGGDKALLYTLYNVSLGLIKMLAPFFCHITEELYQSLFRSTEGEVSIHISPWPTPDVRDEGSKNIGDLVVEITAAVRSYKSEAEIALNAPMGEVMISGVEAEVLRSSVEDIKAPMNASGISFVDPDNLEEIVTGAKPDFAKIGPAFRNDAPHIFKAIEETDPKEIWDSVKDDGFTINVPGRGEVLIDDEFIKFERSMSMKGRPVRSLKVPDSDITVFVERDGSK